MDAAWVRAWLVAFALTLVVEVPLVVWLGRALEPRLGRRVAFALFANLASHPAVWFVFPALPLGWAAATSLAECWAWLSEAALYRLGLPTARWSSALGLSFVANLASFGIGLGLWAIGALG